MKAVDWNSLQSADERHMQSRVRELVLTGLVVIATAWIFSKAPIRQDPNYHNFSDQRTFFGIQNFLDVVSNLPFLLVGVWGLVVITSNKHAKGFLTQSERWPYGVFLLGVALTCFGSGYYHLHPTNARLVWDRLPMTLGFMGILSATIAERISVKAGVKLLPLLVIAGALSVAYWYSTEARGHGDLRPYYLVQFGSLLFVLATLVLFRTWYTQTWCLGLALACYVAAKVLEAFDQKIYAVGALVSGHTLKHFAAGVAGYFIVLMLSRRTAVRHMDANGSSGRTHVTSTSN